MEIYGKDIIPHIESVYHNMTPIEKTIADFFIHQPDKSDLSSKSVAARLFVSEASLSRFAKKCGFRGYREFVFCYEQEPVRAQVVENSQTKLVLNTYQELLNKSYSLIDERQMQRIVQLLSTKKRVYVYGKGSSGTVGMEMKIRFMRIGINLEAMTDSHLFKINSVLLDESCLVIGITVSGRTEILDAMKAAKRQGAATILMTAHQNSSYADYCDEVMLFAVKENLQKGKAISPQFPVLVMVDILFAHLLESDKFHREALHESTLYALDELSDHDET